MRNHDYKEWFYGDFYSPNVDGTGPRSHHPEPVNLTKPWKRFHNMIMEKETSEPEFICSICSWRKDHPLHES